MKPYILLYDVDDYPDNGGGLHFMEFETIERLDEEVEAIYNTHKIILAGKVERYTYNPIEIITKIKRDDSD
jgi:hypothetical protein